MDQTDRAERMRRLEEAHSAAVKTQAQYLSVSKPPKLDHPYHVFRVKLIWKLLLGRDAQGVKLGLNYRKLALIATPLLILLIIFSVYTSLISKNISYSFSSELNCAASPLIFPGLFTRSTSKYFKLTRTSTRILGMDVYSGRICASPLFSPKNNSKYVNQEALDIFGLKLSKNIIIKTNSYVLADAAKLGQAAIPIQKPLVIELASADHTFSYGLSANNLTAPCIKSSAQLNCNLSPLKLSYGVSYRVSLMRFFKGRTSGTVLTRSIQTITATAISATSIGNGTTVFSKPQSVVIATTKNLESVGIVSLTYVVAGKPISVPVKTSFKANQISVTWTEELARQTNFDLHLTNVNAVDNSTLEQPYDLTFTTSGGPTVVSSNIPSFGLNSGQVLSLSFNQPLDPNQNITSLASLIVNGQAEAATINLISANQLSIIPSAAYPVCASVKVVVSANVLSNYDISGSPAWSYTTRSHCYITYSIGTSVQGRPITAYQFGSNPASNMVLFIGAMHGAEQNAGNLLKQWIPNIDANPGKIPSGRTIVVIPIINPDGYAADNRLNAQGIDLNRNFPATGWTEQVTEPFSGGNITNAGGPYPLSAPESQALATYYETYKPRLTLTFHSRGGIVEANDAGDSIPLGAEYARLAYYQAIPTYQIGNFFDYSTTGAFEDWANDRFNLPVLVVELESATNDEYTRNLPALWAMVRV